MKRKFGLNIWGKGFWFDFLALWGVDGEEFYIARKEYFYFVIGFCKIKLLLCIFCICIKIIICNFCKEFINLIVIFVSS